MRRLSRLELFLAPVVLVVVGTSVYILGANLHWWPTINGPVLFQPQSVTSPEAKSADLAADIEAMWETSVNEYGSVASTNDAIDAANRVFNTVDLVGMTGAETKVLLGSPASSNDSVYGSSAFWPIKKRAMIYRFDNGSFGWQVNVYCEGDDQTVTEVEKLWIH